MDVAALAAAAFGRAQARKSLPERGSFFVVATVALAVGILQLGGECVQTTMGCACCVPVECVCSGVLCLNACI